MRLFRNHYRVEGGSSGGFEYFGSRAGALAAAKAADAEKAEVDKTDPVAEEVEVVANKKGILWALNHLAGHADNG